MKIILFANTGWYIYNFQRNLADVLQRSGHEVLVISPRDEYAARLTGLGLKHLPIAMSRRGVNPFVEVLTLMRLFRVLRRSRPDVLLSFTVKCNLYAGICRRLVKFEQIANVTGLGEAFEKRGPINRIVCWLYKWSLRKTRRVFLQNDDDLQTVVGRGLLSVDLCRRIPGSGVDVESFQPASWGKACSRRRFLMFGRLVPQKGYDLFMQAAQRILRNRPNAAEFWIMGMPDESRAESKELLRRIENQQEQGTVRLLAPSDGVKSVLDEVDVVVLPSRYNEGVPRSLLEAMACGKCVITANRKGCRDAVQHRKNGYLIQPDDCSALERYMLELIDAPREKLDWMGAEGRRMAEAEFDQKHVLDAYCGEINHICPGV